VLARWIAFGSLVLVPQLAVAQATGAPPRLSAGAGGGFAIPFHADFDFTPWAWEADLRLAMARHVLFEVAVGEWHHSQTRVSTNLPGATPAELIGRVEQQTTRMQRTLQANVLFTANTGRVRVTAGGGVGLLQHRRRTRTLTEGCAPEMLCGSFESNVSNARGAAQGVGGAEVRLTAGFALYGQARLVVPMHDPGGSDLRITTGLRWGFGN
jgi:hypothetical protein